MKGGAAVAVGTNGEIEKLDCCVVWNYTVVNIDYLL